VPVSAIVTTPGAGTANSYATIAEATQYHADHPYGTAWATATDERRAQTLITATRLIDEEFTFDGVPAFLDQALAWPRYGLVTRAGAVIAHTEVPRGLKDATAEFARWLLAEDRTAESEAQAQGLTKLKAGPVELTFSESAGRVIVPDVIARMLAIWTVSGGGDQRRVIRV